MSTHYTPIVGTLGYVLSPDSERVLMIHRNARADDDHLGKYNGLGGKMRPDEDVAACMRREIREEARIECEELVLRGTINWTGFGPGGEDWLAFVFRIDRFSGEPPERNEEGELLWVPVAKLLANELPQWEGDKHFLPLVFDDDPRTFHGYMPYDNDRPLNWEWVRI
jgi:8-oxo-dGTP diphosphatase